ncbi:VOC family protein [Streptomyces avermitilis]|uniref:VOC domain-containing protein n=1 Tax=Streptomyces avermitilis TaxID=33903 RepID=A0A4D4M9G2_STRAX|nr:hypothetical protein [Streptomyces avermitilis]GDY68473.1 hypothetical protein SAV14893_078660 [Streptomyces avermitilis]GDY71154.1 hypothetical protein SAV31267_006390 [Streptomyces avermitilis]
MDALTGLPFPNDERERQTKTGPRGLGVVVGLEVADVDAVACYCRSAGCQVTVDPVDALWGERYCECVDRYGYCWKFFQLLPEQKNDGLDAAYDSWFGPAAETNVSD